MSNKSLSPAYYRRTINGAEIQLYDIEEAWDLDKHKSAALEYILRSAFKDSEEEDIDKAIRRLKRWKYETQMAKRKRGAA